MRGTRYRKGKLDGRRFVWRSGHNDIKHFMHFHLTVLVVFQFTRYGEGIALKTHLLYQHRA